MKAKAKQGPGKTSANNKDNKDNNMANSRKHRRGRGKLETENYYCASVPFASGSGAAGLFTVLLNDAVDFIDLRKPIGFCGFRE